MECLKGFEAYYGLGFSATMRSCIGAAIKHNALRFCVVPAAVLGVLFAYSSNSLRAVVGLLVWLTSCQWFFPFGSLAAFAFLPRPL